MDMKNLSFCQVKWVKKFSYYHFQIDDWQKKTNATVDTLSHFSQRSKTKEQTLRAENSQIFYHL